MSWGAFHVYIPPSKSEPAWILIQVSLVNWFSMKLPVGSYSRASTGHWYFQENEVNNPLIIPEDEVPKEVRLLDLLT